MGWAEGEKSRGGSNRPAVLVFLSVHFPAWRGSGEDYKQQEHQRDYHNRQAAGQQATAVV